MHLFIYSSFVLTSGGGGWLSCYLGPLLISCRGGSIQGAAIFTIERGSGGGSFPVFATQHWKSRLGWLGRFKKKNCFEGEGEDVKDVQVSAKHNTEIPGPAIYTENQDSHLTQT